MTFHFSHFDLIFFFPTPFFSFFYPINYVIKRKKGVHFYILKGHYRYFLNIFKYLKLINIIKSSSNTTTTTTNSNDRRPSS